LSDALHRASRPLKSLAFEVFPETSQIQSEQAYLKSDQGVSVSWPSPDDPENVAQDETPKTYHSPTGLL
jgi:hypothetical protein